MADGLLILVSAAMYSKRTTRSCWLGPLMMLFSVSRAKDLQFLLPSSPYDAETNGAIALQDRALAIVHMGKSSVMPAPSASLDACMPSSELWWPIRHEASTAQCSSRGARHCAAGFERCPANACATERQGCNNSRWDLASASAVSRKNYLLFAALASLSAVDSAAPVSLIMPWWRSRAGEAGQHGRAMGRALCHRQHARRRG